MPYSDEQLLGKLNGLDETQESIVGASKWVLSYYRDADKIANCWKDFVLKSSTNTRRKLLSIYLANDVIQQAKHKRIGQFSDSFGKIMPQVMGKVYPELPQDLGKKVKRVVDIWKQRQVFSDSVLKDVLVRLKSRKPVEKSDFGRVPELKPINEILQRLVGCQAGISSTRTRFDSSVNAMDPSSVVYMENYKTVVKIGQAAKDALSKAIEQREMAIQEFKKLQDFQSEQLAQDLDMIQEIDSVLASKDPTSQTPADVGETLALPTYEASDSDDDSDSDHGGTKRSRDEEGDPEDSKKIKTVALGLEESEETEVEPSPAEVAANASVTVTSSIQDLLSKLAN
ncbi:LAMI_0D03972g1_1 [Lachancea mirantina]|uniref:LAMI_0D03972g1_1 n=1 Tax=Lachancea mirantina TaxID=1230905 RepID=A0A1G4JA53_9SACH|nr:LAMI_0D03972g1_1 [Lachancea mirantina]